MDFAQTRLHQCARAYARALEDLRVAQGKGEPPPGLKSPVEHELRALRREVHEAEYDLLEAACVFKKAGG
jgi:hypothetical protein